MGRKWSGLAWKESAPPVRDETLRWLQIGWKLWHKAAIILPAQLPSGSKQNTFLAFIQALLAPGQGEYISRAVLCSSCPEMGQLEWIAHF